jgi:hypothetical protein
MAPAASTPKLNTGICIYQADNVIITGLTFKDWYLMAIYGHANGSQSGDEILNNTVLNTVGTSESFGNGNTAALNFVGSFPGLLVANNYINGADEDGIGLTQPSTQSGASAGAIIASNAVLNTCTGVSDCGALYVSGLTQAGCLEGQKTITGNYVNSTSMALYNDGGSCNNTWTYNVAVGFNLSFAQGAHQNAANNVRFDNNIFDLGTTGGDIIEYQYFAVNAMTGNEMKNNIIVCNSSASPCGNGYIGQSSPPNPMTVADNLYFNYGSGTGGESGVNNSCTGGACSTDSNPTGANPQLEQCPSNGASAWSYLLNPSSLAFGSPVDFVQPNNFSGIAWGQPGFWGPPGYTIPDTGTLPSYGPCN